MGIFRKTEVTPPDREKNKVRSVFNEPATVEACARDYEDAADVRERFDKAAKRQHRK